MPSVAVIVLAWNGAAWLRPCLGALRAQEYAGRHVTLVVDNGSTDGTAELVAAEFPEAALIRSPRNLGFAGGNNLALRALRAGGAPAPADFAPDVAVLLNQDTEVAPGWLAALADALDRNPAAGAAGCKILGPDGLLQHAGGQLDWPLAEGGHRGAGAPDGPGYNQEGPVEWVTGAAMAIRMALPAELTLLDEGYSPAYYEDVDLCYRIRAAGHSVIYAPAARLTHHENSSLGAQSAGHQRAYHHGRVRFVLRHGPLGAGLADFTAAERAAIGRWSLADSLARKAAYRDALADLPAILGARGARAELPAVAAALRELHAAAVAEERARRAETIAPAAQRHEGQATATPGQEIASAEPAPAPIDQENAMTTPDNAAPQEEPVDVAAIMRQIRKNIAERREREDDRELDRALAEVNERWSGIHEPLRLPPAASLPGRAWDVFRTRLHHGVRGYLDGMIFRQTEFNSSVVRALNSLARRERAPNVGPEVEALRDEIIQLREELRRLREQVEETIRP
jgi:GT2 family glycosyltransferase